MLAFSTALGSCKPNVAVLGREKACFHAGDLDKLLGSRLKSVVRPPAEVRQTEEAADSPVVALRGQLRRVKLEEGVEASSSPLRGPQDQPSSVAGASSSQVAYTQTSSCRCSTSGRIENL